ncbi:MAG: hypothetical protein GF383_08035 [Candidatus Lokiarchaeota archaeon]|nr:hypothetical protein [Candidatus Lokiarchaeota archaeon]MBD3340281.1 hypothetical protein [Candidatus Lokiarchaeota archaeon]
MSKVQIRCPICSKSQDVDISDADLKNVSRGLLAINITTGAICDHSFIAYVDKNRKVRDYFTADFQIGLPEMTSKEEVASEQIPSSAQINLDVVKSNITALLLSYIINSILNGKEILLIVENPEIEPKITEFLKFITQKSFNFKLKALTLDEYKSDKKKYKKWMVFNGNEIINNADKSIDAKKLKVEKMLVSKFMNEPESNYGAVVLKNEVKKIFMFCELIMKVIDTNKDKTLNSKFLIDNLEEAYNIKVDINFLNFIIDSIEHYFNYEVPKIDNLSDFLGFL